jgi:6,7-dimethyl-8-ribityllumazine synthase
MENKNLLEKLNVLIVEARFYEKYSNGLLAGARSVLDKVGVSYDILTTPGALEIPGVISSAAQGRVFYDGYIALGCVIRGQTYHFNLVAKESFRGLIDLTIAQNLAIGNGIITVYDETQAHDRTSSINNKGAFAARAMLDVIALKRTLGVS